MQNKALVIIDIQNDITKNYKDIIDNINNAIEWAVDNQIFVIYIKHENVSIGTRTFKRNTRGIELVSQLKIVSNNIFTKQKSSILSCEPFTDFIEKNDINEFYVAGADAVVCVKSSCYNLRKANYEVHVLSDCVTSYDKKKIPDMLQYYKDKGCHVTVLKDLLNK